MSLNCFMNVSFVPYVRNQRSMFRHHSLGSRKRHNTEEILRQSTYGTNLIKTSSIKMRQGTRLRNNENGDINISLWIFHILIPHTSISYYFIYIFFARSHIDTNNMYETSIEYKYNLLIQTRN